MTNTLSLRARLTFVILVPLLLIAVLFGRWAYTDAQANAAERFERSLLSTALAISRDIAVTGGDALSEDTRDLLRDTSGGAVFYHVYAPDGVFVTGYATPPVVPNTAQTTGAQTYYDAIYRGQQVKALRFTQTMAVDQLSGPFTFTVWQNTSLRDGFVRSRTRPAFLIIASMVGALAVIVWFGVRLGLYPLMDLENAIERRSANDLSPIRRAIPVEVSGIVGKFNALLDELSRTLKAKDIFISDAAHQLRNPIAGVLSLAESIQSSKTLEDVEARSADLIEAARTTAALANNLLTLERARAAPRQEDLSRFDPLAVLHELSHNFHKTAETAGVSFRTLIAGASVGLVGDRVLFEQAVLNLLNNALAHGGTELSAIELRAEVEGALLYVAVTDDGKGINEPDFAKARARFSQLTPSSGSGLGLPIAEAIAEAFGGALRLERHGGSFTVALEFQLHERGDPAQTLARSTSRV